MNNSDKLFKLSSTLLGRRISNGINKVSFFGHFCAGETESEIKPKVQWLSAHGIGGILDYAAEGDLPPEDRPVHKNFPEDLLDSQKILQTLDSRVFHARTYDYEGEAKCEVNVGIFFKCIEAVHNVAPEGFAAIKVTALGLPAILEKLSTAILEIQHLFIKWDTTGEGKLSPEAFKKALLHFAPDLSPAEVEDITKEFMWDGWVDYIQWTHAIKLERVFTMISTTKQLHFTSFSAEEDQLVDNIYHRVQKIAEFAHRMNVRLMIDAEHTYFQPAIDHLVLHLQRQFNKEAPLIFHTYQCYLTQSHEKIVHDLERARREGYWFAAKIVRGAYMDLERARAKSMNYPSPIYPTYEETTKNYERALATVLDEIDRSSVLVATHNESSISFVLSHMEQNNIDKAGGRVYFGQLLGMSDRLTFTLGQNGYKAYKYVPYGPVHEVIPYLIRRAQENSSVLGGGNQEIDMLKKELFRRIFPYSTLPIL